MEQFRLNTAVFFLLVLLLHDLSVDNKLFAQANGGKLDQFLQKKMEKAGLLGLQAGKIEEGELVWTGSYGVKNVETQAPVNDSTLFMIASCSKPVTALALMILYDQGVIHLDEAIDNYLPFFIVHPEHPKADITFRMLLTHTAALKDNWEVLDLQYTLEEGGGDAPLALGDYVRDYFQAEGRFYDAEKNFLQEAPGQRYEYCNMGYALIGYLIEVITGRPFAEYVGEAVFQPLGMNDTYWFLRDIPHDNIARPHRMPEKGAVGQSPEVLPHYGYPDYPDGQIRTTVSDCAQIVRLMLNKGAVDGVRLLKEETVDEFLAVPFPEAAKWQAIAWNYNEFDHWLYYLLMPRLPSHTGGDPGVTTVVSFDPDNGDGAILFTNSPPTSFKGYKSFYQEMVKKLLK